MTTLKCVLAIFLHLFAVEDRENGITNDEAESCKTHPREAAHEASCYTENRLLQVAHK